MNRQKVINILKEKAIQNSAFIEKSETKDPQAIIPSNLSNDGEWLLYMYKHILKMNIGPDDPGYQHWIVRIREGVPKSEIEKYFRQVASTENQKVQIAPITFECLLNKEDKGRVLVVLPESAGDIFLMTSLFKSIKTRYPDWTLYIATKGQYRDILLGNPFVDKWLEYHPMMENLTWLEGNSTHNGYFNIAYLAHASTQRYINYYHNGIDKIDFPIKTI